MDNNVKSRQSEVFDFIAPIYGLFYTYQKRHYTSVLDKIKDVDLSQYRTIIDIGCGTGALCSVLSQRGFIVTGIDPALKMLSVGARKQENKAIEFIQASALNRLPFADKSFDVCIASHVAHGLKGDARRTMYAEMNRITRHLVIIYDYNQHRSPLVDFIEWLEGGDYFNFIKHAEAEVRESFNDVRVLNVGLRSAWYIGAPAP